MAIIPVVIILVLAGVLLWVVNAYLPLDRRIKMIINILVVITVIVWLLRVFGILGGAPVT